mgnify:CR=1 FL=1
MIKIKELIVKYKELLLYLIFGVLTTAVNFLAFWVFTKILGEELYLINNAIAWVVGVIFAFVTNKIFVFESKSPPKNVIILSMFIIPIKRTASIKFDIKNHFDFILFFKLILIKKFNLLLIRLTYF